MRARLMFDDRDFRTERPPRFDDQNLVQDLELGTLWAVAAGDDEYIGASIRTAMLSPLTNPEQITYRQDVVADCLQEAAVVRELYQIAGQAIAEERKIYRASFFTQSTEALLSRSVNALTMFLGSLTHLRALTEDHAHQFHSPGFTTFFATLSRELDDDYMDEISNHLRTLRFRDGLLASARLGQQNQGIEYALRTPRTQNQGNAMLRHPPVKKPHYSRTIARGDDAGHQELAALRDRVLSLATDALARSAEHILSFYTALRNDLAFYVGCLNLHDHLTARGGPVCRPDPCPRASGVLNASALYDPCLVLRSTDRVHGNDLRADGKPLVLITGANQGGKSTFLRSLGLAQLMMQSGMFVAASSFAAATVSGVFTHYKREEDATMVSGKFDEELHRMSDIARHIQPHSLLLCNESFAATNEREGSDIAAEIIAAMSHVGITIVYVTHLYELAHRFQQQRCATTVFLRAERDTNGPRPFRLIEAEPLPTSYGEDLYRNAFGADAPPPSPLIGPTRGEGGS